MTTTGTKKSSDRKKKSEKPEGRSMAEIKNIIISKKCALFLMALVIVGIPVTRNTAIRFAETSWSMCSELLNGWWEHVLSITGENPIVIWVIIPNLINFGVYWLYGSLYTFVDITGKPAILKKYKVQPGENDPVDTTKLRQAIKAVVFNQIFVNAPMSVIFYLIKEYRGLPPLRPLPNIFVHIFHYAIIKLCIEVCVYYSHRAMHHKSIYKYIHKKHHEWTAPIAVIAIYCNPIEQVFSAFSAMIGVAITNCHPITAWIWFFCDTVNVIDGHAGYNIPHWNDPSFHDFHHSKTTECYGVIGLLDWLHGTDKLFKKSTEDSRSGNPSGIESANDRDDHKYK